MSTPLLIADRPRAALARLALLAAVQCALPAVAAEPAKGRAATAKPKAAPLMTRAELRDCMARLASNRTETDALVADQEKLSGEKAALLAQGEALNQQQATLDRSSPEAVAKYNDEVVARNAAIDALTTRSTAFNARVEAAQTARSAYVASCENRRFDERDEIAIRNGK